MAEDTISTFTSDPEKLAQLLQQWNAQHQRLYDNKRAAMKEHRKKCTINCASEVDQQWPAGSLKETYLSELAKGAVVSHSQHQNSKNHRQLLAASLSREVIKYGEMAQVTYDKLETKNVFSPHFGECRDGWIKLHHSDPDNTLLVGREARQYKATVLLQRIIKLSQLGAANHSH